MVLIGAGLLATSGAILIANNNSSTPEECCDKTKCEQGVCKPTADCPDPATCCKK
jgi:hypothetical protein